MSDLGQSGAMLLGVFQGLTGLLGQLSAGNPKDAQIALLKAQLEIMEKQLGVYADEASRTELERDRLRQEVAKLREELERYGSINRGGLLWVKRPDGTIEDEPRCPLCKLTLVSRSYKFVSPYKCGDSKCGYETWVYPAQIEQFRPRLDS